MAAGKSGGTGRRKAPRTARKEKKVEDRNMNVQFAGELPPSSSQKVNITLTNPSLFRRVDVAVVDPLGRGRIIKAEKNNGGFLATFSPSQPGTYLASVAAYSRKYSIINEISFRVREPAGNGKGAENVNASGPKPKEIKVPPVPDRFKAENITTWPNSSSYAQSLQNLSFSVSENLSNLRNSTLERNANVKYPSYIFGSGNFGTVFKLNSSGKFYALKCFTRASAGLAERYYNIGYYISELKLPFLVEFQYLPGAVRMITNPKQFYPVLRMEWITGQSLNEYVEKNLKAPNKLRKAAREILDMVDTLQANGLAHGDLSGDNILITDSGELRLIDYDGMFVPPFSGRSAPEKGHDNFQHPGRNEHFSAALDNFGLLVIYASLMALARRPELWEYNNGDGDKLIYTAADFKDPGSSDLMKEISTLRGIPAKLNSLLKTFLTKDPLWSGASPSKIRNLK